MTISAALQHCRVLFDRVPVDPPLFHCLSSSLRPCPVLGVPTPVRVPSHARGLYSQFNGDPARIPSFQHLADTAFRSASPEVLAAFHPGWPLIAGNAMLCWLSLLHQLARDHQCRPLRVEAYSRETFSSVDGEHVGSISVVELHPDVFTASVRAIDFLLESSALKNQATQAERAEGSGGTGGAGDTPDTSTPAPPAARESEGGMPPTNLRQYAKPFDTLRSFAAARLKGQERAVIEALCDANGELPIADLAVKEGVDWTDSIQGFKNSRNRLTPKLRKQGWRLRQQNLNAKLMVIERNMPGSK